MKKIVTMGAIAVLAAGFMFADEPAADVSITEFSGNAKVTWGMDLDAGKTGFKNTEEANFKVKLFAGGDKVTTGEGTWAELKIKTDGLKLENGEWKDGKASVDAAKLHFGNIFVGIRSGDTQVGAYKFDGAIRSADSDHAKWIKDVGPANFKYGIDAGYDSTDFNVTVNLRSYVLDGKAAWGTKDKDGKYPIEIDQTQYTNSYSISLEAGLKDSNAFVPGLFVNAGFAYNLSNENYGYGWATFNEKDKKVWEKEVQRNQFYSDMKVNGANLQNGHTLGYSFNLGYKLALDDKYFVKPAVAFAGQTVSGEFNIPDNQNNERWYKASTNTNDLAFGLMFGWGSVADDNAGVPFLDGDYAKKVQPGVSVVVDIPLAQTDKWFKKVGNDIKAAKDVTHNSLLALIVPSVHTKGELVEGLKASVYSEIGLLRYKDWDKTADANKHDASATKTNNDATDTETWNNCYWKDQKFAFALAAGLKYDIKSGDYTITPAVGFRFVNEAYVENGISGRNPLSADPVFTGLGEQDTIRDANNAKLKYGNGGLVAGYFNLKAGVDFGGFINNTTFSVEYASANLLNKKNYVDEKISVNGKEIANPNYKSHAFNHKLYNVKLGTLDVGCKIAF